jgi:hypothetical protein
MAKETNGDLKDDRLGSSMSDEKLRGVADEGEDFEDADEMDEEDAGEEAEDDSTF